ncbi:MAG: GGDEF domain-containing protein [Oscillospiraceae bacterium]|nr:GGDEF domain-containing protein [Oscillospiraceae bacterium]
MKTPKEYFKSKIEKVNVQVSLLSCALVIVSCLVIYLVTSGIMVSILIDAYDERANLTFETIEFHLDSRLYQDDIPDGAYSAVMSYLTAVKENMAISEIFIVKKDSEGNLIYILDTNNEKNAADIRTETVTGKIEKRIRNMYIVNYVSSGDFFSVADAYRYMNFYPVSDDGRNVKGVIGIGIDAGYVRTARIIMNILVGILILLCCLISVRFSTVIFRKISNPLYQDASNTDTLTGLKNKNSFTVDLHNIEGNNTERYSVITIDLNGLKNINDTRGHQAGDMFIQRASKILKSAMEGTDFIGYRVGGDEFSIIGKDKSLEDVKSFVDNINKLIDEGNKTRGMLLTMSIGYAKFDKEKDRNFSMTIERSDAMMYENKRLYYKMKNQTPR